VKIHIHIQEYVTISQTNYSVMSFYENCVSPIVFFLAQIPTTKKRSFKEYVINYFVYIYNCNLSSFTLT